MLPALPQDLVRGLAGRVLEPHHPDYDKARTVHNGLVDKRPAAIVRARHARDVVDALALARGAGLEVSVRGGGHNLAVTGGAVSTTGIAGLTLGGGLGWLMGKHGLAADNLLAVDLVTAAR